MPFSQLLFISNELLSPIKRKEMNLPLEFITFALVEAKMYKHYRSQTSFILPNPIGTSYGALFLLKDPFFYLRVLDAYHSCSLDVLRKNHTLDLHHRITISATPITFDSIDDWERLKYLEHEPIKAQTFIGNLTHPKINQRLVKSNSYRIKDGVDKHIQSLIREVLP